jgi:hypothetical protein
MKLKLKNILRENRKEVSWESLPNTLYHVTTAKNKVLQSGYLKSQAGLENGGLGGTESVGVSLVTDYQVANNIYEELYLINLANSLTNVEQLPMFLSKISDDDRKRNIKDYFNYYYEVYNTVSDTLIMMLRLDRDSYKNINKPYYGIIIFNESNIKDKDISILKVSKNNIPKDAKIIEGVDVDFGEIRVLTDVKI